MGSVTPLEIKLASIIVHLAELHSKGGHSFDLDAAQSVITSSPEVAEFLKPGPLLPVTRSGQSVAQLLGIEPIKKKS
jgi:hypothetical protein